MFSRIVVGNLYTAMYLKSNILLIEKVLKGNGTARQYIVPVTHYCVPYYAQFIELRGAKISRPNPLHE